ncbi:MAG: magnesium transporter [Phycisphaera sp.]|nr:magnesium transporter [Phycisphaera sp.]
MSDEMDIDGVGRLLAPDIVESIDAKRTADVLAAFSELQDAEVAVVLEELDDSRRIVAMRLLPRARAAEVFAYLDHDLKEQIITGLSDDVAAQIFNEMDPDDRIDFFEEAEDDLAQSLLKRMRPAERKETEYLLEYPEESVGREMTPDFLKIQPEWTVQQALDHIRAHGAKAESLDTLYVTDKNNRLINHLRLRRLVLADPNDRVESLLKTTRTTVRINAMADREELVTKMEEYDLPVLPVVDEKDELVGIVTFDDVADVAEEEVTEDMHKMGGLEALDEPYMAASIPTLVRKRGIWLAVLFIGEMFTASAMSLFEHQIAEAIVLALFLPLIISSGGNSGSQATSLIIRAMALGEVTIADWWEVARRELICGLLLGALLGLIGLLRVQLWQWLGLADYTKDYFLVGLTVSISLVGVVTLGTLVGSMLPLILRRLRLDPASVSAPFVATIVDVCGLLIYFGVATVMLGL